jgi:hypothetical protein
MRPTGSPDSDIHFAKSLAALCLTHLSLSLGIMIVGYLINKVFDGRVVQIMSKRADHGQYIPYIRPFGR